MTRPSLTLPERRQLARLAVTIRRGDTRHFRLRQRTERLIGRDAPMGLASQGRIANFQYLISFLRGEPVYRHKEVSPRFDLVLIVQRTAEPRYDDRLFAVARAFGYLATAVSSGGCVVVRPETLAGDYAPLAQSFGPFDDRLRHIASQQLPLREARPLTTPARLAARLGEMYPGAHFVFIGAYWEPWDIRPLTVCSTSGATFCVVESLGGLGSSWMGGVMPEVLLRQHLKDRAAGCAQACRHNHANFILFPKDRSIVESLDSRFRHRTEIR